MAETMKPCLLIGSAPMGEGALFRDISPEDWFIICADGGLDIAQRHGIRPHLVVGDFDSAVSRPVQSVETIVLPTAKDDTDMMFAIKEGFRRGCRDFRIFGGLGARLDHSYANFCALRYIAQQGGTGILEDDDTWIGLVHPEKPTLTLYHQQGRTVSVFPFGEPSCTLSYEGMRYPLEHGTLTVSEPVGVSNVVEHEQAQVTLHEGCAIVLLMKHVLAE